MRLNVKKCEDFVLNLYDGQQGSFLFSPDYQINNLLSTCFGVLSLNLINCLHLIDKDKTAKYILRFCDKKTGRFIDNSIKQKNYKKKHNWNYLVMQLTDFSLLSIQALSCELKIKLGFLKEYKQDLIGYLENLNWENPWSCSNEVMFILNSLIYEERFEGADNYQYISCIMDWLDRHQDSRTGFWNLGHQVSLHNQMAAAYHFLFFYTYLNRQPRYLERIIDSTLTIQNYDGLFSYAGGGGSCDDLDAIDLLCRAICYTDYRKKDIEIALAKAYQALLQNQNEDGGFCWAKRNRINLRQLTGSINLNLLKQGSSTDFIENFTHKTMNFLLTLFYPKLLIWRQSGLKKMEIRLESSDLWSTYSRLLGISIIEKRFPDFKGNNEDIKWNHIRFPGIGYLGW